LLERVRAASKDMWFTSVALDMDGRVKLSVLIRDRSSGRSCWYGITRHLEAFKKYENHFRSVRLKRITWQPYLDSVVAAADLEMVLSEP
jgi:hypothetical protein